MLVLIVEHHDLAVGGLILGDEPAAGDGSVDRFVGAEGESKDALGGLHLDERKLDVALDVLNEEVAEESEGAADGGFSTLD